MVWEQGGRCDWRLPTAVGLDGRSCHELTRASTLGAVGMRGQKGKVGRRIVTGPFPRSGGCILSVLTLL